VHPHCEQQTLGVGDDMALTPLDALAGVDPARAAALGGRHALTVDNTGRRHRIASQTLPGARHQNGIEPIPGAVVAPPVEVPLHRRARRKLARQGAPLTAAPQDIEEGVDNRAQMPAARPPALRRRRQQRGNLGPFRLARIACIDQVVAAILRAGGFSPHVVAPGLSCNNRESQLIEITQPISGPASQDEERS